MNFLKYILLTFAIGSLIVSCEPKAEPDFVYPLEYLPAYPGSYWIYNNGDQIVTSSSYVLHSYQSSLSSLETTEEVYVPMYDGEYLYEYTITQNSTEYPVKKLLEETVGGNPWMVSDFNGEPTMRAVTKSLDSIIISFPPYADPMDSILVFKDVLVVVEYVDSLGEDNWNLKEYYAKDVGLVRVEANNPYDTLNSIVIKELQQYKIN